MKVSILAPHITVLHDPTMIVWQRTMLWRGMVRSLGARRRLSGRPTTCASKLRQAIVSFLMVMFSR